MAQNRIAVSVADLPLNVSWEKCFATAAAGGADGIELMGGPRAWWNHHLKGLSVASVHQPAWEILGLFVSRLNLRQAAAWTDRYVIHPPLIRGGNGKEYFYRIEAWAKQESVVVMLENMPPIRAKGWLDWLGKTDVKWVQIETVADECRERDWRMTLDTSHWQSVRPDEKRLSKILPVLSNIHISDWDQNKQHLCLGQGLMDVGAWMKWIKENYQGQVTLELTPKYWVNEEDYLRDIKESLRILHQWLD